MQHQNIKNLLISSCFAFMIRCSSLSGPRHTCSYNYATSHSHFQWRTKQSCDSPEDYRQQMKRVTGREKRGQSLTLSTA